MGKWQCNSSCSCIDKTTVPIISVFSSFESSIKAFDNIFGNVFASWIPCYWTFCFSSTGSVRNGWKFAVAKWTTCCVGYSLLVVHVQNVAYFGLSLTLYTLRHLSLLFRKWRFLEIRKKIVSSEISTFWVFFILMRVCVFGFNVAFNNFSVISRRCLVATGSSMLTFIVLPHWSIMSQSHYPDTGSTSPSSTP